MAVDIHGLQQGRPKRDVLVGVIRQPKRENHYGGAELHGRDWSYTSAPNSVGR